MSPHPDPGSPGFLAKVSTAEERGEHPLSVGLERTIPLHPTAPPLDDRSAPGPRCGSCAHRRSGRGTNQHRRRRHRPKCELPGRATSRITSDVPAWWPACTDHEEVPR